MGTGQIMSLMEKVRRASKSVVDAGAKQMLKTDIIFLDREINNRKQLFGTEIYDLMEELEAAEGMSGQDKEAKIRATFDNAREEMAVLVTTADVGTVPAESPIPPSSGDILNN